MRKVYFLVVFVLFTAGVVKGQNAIVGDGFSSGWGNPCTNSTDFKFLASGAGTSYILTTQANNMGDQFFRFGFDYGTAHEQWTETIGTDVLLNPGTQYHLNTNCTNNGAFKINVTSTTDNYIFKTRDFNPNPSGDIVVFEVKGDIRTVTSVSQSPTSVQLWDDVTVTASLSGAFSTGQSAYLRYTIDNWATSTVVEMTGSGTTRTGTIPSAVNGYGNTIEYYVFTSGSGLTIPGDDADLFTINYKIDDANNYTYSFSNNVDVFDDFNRTTGNNVGEPSSNPGSDWSEYETTAAGARINGGQLRLGSGTAGRDIISFDMTGKYPVAFDEATETMRWAVNMRSNRNNPSGFDDSNYGSAFILGSNKSNFTDGDAYGYAVVLGGGTKVSGERQLRLIRFHDGLELNSNIDEIATVTLADDRNFLSVNVEYNSCTQTWTLRAREASSFSQPSIGAFPLSDTGVDNTYTSTEIPHLGMLANHGTDSSVEFQGDNIYIPESSIATDNTYTWAGSASGDFNIPSNWSPQRNCVRNRDVLVFDGGTVDVSNVPDQTIGQFIVQNNASVTLRNQVSQAVSTLNLTGGPGEDLEIESGSTLNLNSEHSSYTTEGITISMNTATTGEIAGSLQFDNSFNGDGRRHQLLVADANAIHVKNGGKIDAIALLSSYHPFGDSGSNGVVVFENGSEYVQGSGSHPFGFAQPDSKVVFETGSWFQYTSTGNDPSISGRTYANFKYKAGTKNITLGNNDYHIDTFEVAQGTFNLNLNANATIAGDIEVASGAQLTFNPGTSGTVNVDAPVVQNIFGSGTMTIGQHATLNLQNQNRINLQKNIGVSGTANVVADAIVDFEGENWFSGSGTTTFQNNSTVYLGSSGGIAASGNSGNVRTTNRSYSGQTAYIYDGAVNQITGTGLPTTLSGNGKLEIANIGTAPNNTVALTNSGTTTTPKLTLTSGLFAVGATNTVAIANNGSVESTSGNFAAGNLAGTVAFAGTGTVAASGNLDFWNVTLPAGSGGLDFGANGTEMIHNEMVIGTGRSVQNKGPFYADNSTLIYNTNGNFTAGTEWYANTPSGRGVPYDVQVGRTGVNNTKMNFGSSNAWRYCRGDMRIGDSGGGSGYVFDLSTTDYGDLKLDGDFIVQSNGDFDANQRAVFFLGNTDQTITSHASGNTVHFDYMIVDKSGSDLLLDNSPGTTVYAEGGPNGNVLVLSGGDFDLQGQKFYLGGTGPVMQVQNGNRTVKSSTPAEFNVIGEKEVQSSSSGRLIFNDQVTVNISAGMNFGPDVTTINATLQINADGFAKTNAPTYGPQGVLKYNTGANPYKRRVEWSGTEGNAGFPNDVIVAGNTILNPGGDPINSNTGGDFGARRDVTIESGSAIYMDYGGDDMTVPLKVGRNLTISGELSASGVVGGDIYVGGNWVRNSGGVFNPKNRQVLFNGTTAQTITASGGETFDYLAFANTGIKTLLDDISVNKEIKIESGSAALSGNNKTIHLLGNWVNEEGQAAFDETNTTVLFEGSSLQTVSCANSSFEGFDDVKMDNSGPGIKLDNNMAIYGHLEFVDGLIDATVNRVDFQDGATYSGSGDDSYINGFAKKTGFTSDVEFKFPVGQYDSGNAIDVYQPAGIIPDATSPTASFTVDYHHKNYFPWAFYPNDPPMLAPLVAASLCNYWNINRTNGSINAKVKLYWTDACLDINDPTKLVVAKVDGGQWVSQGQSAFSSTSPFDFGSVTSNNLSSFSPFAIGSTDAINVLPIELLSFTAFAKNQLVETHWITSSEINNDFFTVERSMDALHFEEVGRIDGAGTSKVQTNYDFVDDAPYPGISYYRLKQTDFDGKTTYSEIRSVKIAGDFHFDLLQVYRSESGLNLSYRSKAKRLKVSVYDLLGKQLYQSEIENVNGRAVIQPSLARGVYMLRLSNGVEGKVMKFFY